MNKDFVRMAQEAGFCHDINNGVYLCASMHIERFANLVIQEHCERMARAIEAMPFGATSDSFAVFVREFK